MPFLFDSLVTWRFSSSDPHFASSSSMVCAKPTISLPPMGNHRELVRPRFFQSSSPDLLAFDDDVPVEIGVEVGTPVVTPPTLGMEGRDGVRILRRRLAVLHHHDRPSGHSR